MLPPHISLLPTNLLGGRVGQVSSDEMTLVRKSIKLQNLDKLTSNTVVLELSRNALFCNWHPSRSGMPPSVVHKPCHLPCSVETFGLNYCTATVYRVTHGERD